MLHFLKNCFDFNNNWKSNKKNEGKNSNRQSRSMHLENCEERVLLTVSPLTADLPDIQPQEYATLEFSDAFVVNMDAANANDADNNIQQPLAADPVTLTVGTGEGQYATIQAAITAASAGDTIQLTENITLTEALTFEKNLTLDLNGKTLTSSSTATISRISATTYYAIESFNSDLTIKSSVAGGKIAYVSPEGDTQSAMIIVNNGGTLNVEENVTIDGSGAIGTVTAIRNHYRTGYEKAVTNFNSGAEITIENVPSDKQGYGIAVRDYSGSTTIPTSEETANSVLNVAGKITITKAVGATGNVGSYAISGNGTDKGGVWIDIDTGTDINTFGVGIYNPQGGVLNVNNGSITGVESGIAIKSGTLNVFGGTITCTGAAAAPVLTNSNGINGTGSAIQIESNSSYVAPVKVNIIGGTIESTNNYAVQEYIANNQKTTGSTVASLVVNASKATLACGSDKSTMALSDPTEAIPGAADNLVVISGTVSVTKGDESASTSVVAESFKVRIGKTTYGASDGALADALVAAINAAVDGDMIILAEGVYNVPSTLTINKNLTIIGLDTDVDGTVEAVLDGGNAVQIMSISAGKSVTIKNVTFQNGNTTNVGGAIDIAQGALSLSDCTFKYNTASGAYGSAVAVTNTECVFKAENCTFENNNYTGNSNGGALAFSASTPLNSDPAIVKNCTFKNNTSTGNSTSVLVNKFNVNIEDCSFIGNGSTESPKPAVHADYAGTVTITGSYFDGNKGSNGVVYISGDNSLAVRRSVFVNNKCTNKTAGIYSSSWDTTVNDCIFVNNSVTMASNSGGYVGGAITGRYTTVSNNVFVGNKATVGGKYSHLTIGYASETGNVPNFSNNFVDGASNLTSYMDPRTTAGYIADYQCDNVYTTTNVTYQSRQVLVGGTPVRTGLDSTLITFGHLDTSSTDPENPGDPDENQTICSTPEAITSAITNPTEDKTIALGSDVTLTSPLTVGGDAPVSMDLEGKTLTSTSENIVSSGSLNLIGTGTVTRTMNGTPSTFSIDSGSSDGIVLDSTGKLKDFEAGEKIEVTSGSVAVSGTEKGGVVTMGETKIEIVKNQEGSITFTGGEGANVQGLDPIEGSENEYETINIKSGSATVSGNGNVQFNGGCQVLINGSMTVNSSGKITNITNDSTVSVGGITFTATADGGAITVAESETVITIDITDGTFEASGTLTKHVELKSGVDKITEGKVALPEGVAECYLIIRNVKVEEKTKDQAYQGTMSSAGDTLTFKGNNSPEVTPGCYMYDRCPSTADTKYGVTFTGDGNSFYRYEEGLLAIIGTGSQSDTVIIKSVAFPTTDNVDTLQISGVILTIDKDIDITVADSEGNLVVDSEGNPVAYLDSDGSADMVFYTIKQPDEVNFEVANKDELTYIPADSKYIRKTDSILETYGVTFTDGDGEDITVPGTTYEHNIGISTDYVEYVLMPVKNGEGIETEINIIVSDSDKLPDGYLFEGGEEGEEGSVPTSVIFDVSALTSFEFVLGDGTGSDSGTYYIVNQESPASFEIGKDESGGTTVLSMPEGKKENITMVAPPTINKTSVTSTSITLEWTAIENAVYSVRCTKTGETPSAWSNTIDDTSHTFDYLSSDTEYTVEVKAVITEYEADGVTEKGEYDTPAASITDVTAPAAPTNLTVVSFNANSVSLSWTASATADVSYIVERATDSTFENANQIPVDSTSLEDTGLLDGTGYYYRVCAVKNEVPSDYSTSVMATTDPATGTQLEKPIVTAGTIADGTVTETTALLSWTADNNATSYIIEYGPASGTLTHSGSATVDGTTATFTLPGAAGQTVYYRVQAVGDGTTYSSSEWTEVASVEFDTALVMPTITGVSEITANSVKVSWTEDTKPAPTYVLEYSTNNGASWTIVEGATNGGTVNTSPNTSYKFRVTATAPGYTTQVATTEQATLTLPAAPTGLTATAKGDDWVTVSWTAPTGGAASYTLQHKTGDGEWANITISGTETSYDQKGLDANTTYDYQVIATNASGSSNPATTSATTKAALATPTITVSKITANSVTFSWEKDTSITPIYNVSAFPSADPGNSVDPGDIEITDNTATISNLAPNESYTFTVTATAAGYDSQSGEVTAKTYNAPVTVNGLTFTPGVDGLGNNATVTASGNTVTITGPVTVAETDTGYTGGVSVIKGTDADLDGTLSLNDTETFKVGDTTYTNVSGTTNLTITNSTPSVAYDEAYSVTTSEGTTTYSKVAQTVGGLTFTPTDQITINKTESLATVTIDTGTCTVTGTATDDVKMEGTGFNTTETNGIGAKDGVALTIGGTTYTEKGTGVDKLTVVNGELGVVTDGVFQVGSNSYIINSGDSITIDGREFSAGAADAYITITDSNVEVTQGNLIVGNCTTAIGTLTVTGGTAVLDNGANVGSISGTATTDPLADGEKVIVDGKEYTDANPTGNSTITFDNSAVDSYTGAYSDGTTTYSKVAQTVNGVTFTPPTDGTDPEIQITGDSVVVASGEWTVSGKPNGGDVSVTITAPATLSGEVSLDTTYKINNYYTVINGSVEKSGKVTFSDTTYTPSGVYTTDGTTINVTAEADYTLKGLKFDPTDTGSVVINTTTSTATATGACTVSGTAMGNVTMSGSDLDSVGGGIGANNGVVLTIDGKIYTEKDTNKDSKLTVKDGAFSAVTDGVFQVGETGDYQFVNGTATVQTDKVEFTGTGTVTTEATITSGSFIISGTGTVNGIELAAAGVTATAAQFTLDATGDSLSVTSGTASVTSGSIGTINGNAVTASVGNMSVTNGALGVGTSVTIGGVTYTDTTTPDNGTLNNSGEISSGSFDVNGAGTVTVNGGTANVKDGESVTKIIVTSGSATVSGEVTETVEVANGSSLSYCGYLFTANGSGTTTFTIGASGISIAGDATVTDDTPDNEVVAITVTSGTTTITNAITEAGSSIMTSGTGSVAINANATVNGNVTIGSNTENAINANITGALIVTSGTAFIGTDVTVDSVSGSGDIYIGTTTDGNKVTVTTGSVKIASSVITLTTGDEVTTSANVSVTGTGTINGVGISTESEITSATDTGDLTLDGADAVTITSGSPSVSGTGSVKIENASSATIGGDAVIATANVSATLDIEDGEITSVHHGNATLTGGTIANLSITSTGSATLSGTVVNSLTGSKITTSGGGTFNVNDGSVSVDADNVVGLKDATVTVTNGTLATSGNGYVYLEKGEDVIDDVACTNAGATYTGTGVVAFTSGTEVEVQGFDPDEDTGYLGGNVAITDGKSGVKYTLGRKGDSLTYDGTTIYTAGPQYIVVEDSPVCATLTRNDNVVTGTGNYYVGNTYYVSNKDGLNDAIAKVNDGSIDTITLLEGITLTADTTAITGTCTINGVFAITGGDLAVGAAGKVTVGNVVYVANGTATLDMETAGTPYISSGSFDVYTKEATDSTVYVGDTTSTISINNTDSTKAITVTSGKALTLGDGEAVTVTAGDFTVSGGSVTVDAAEGKTASATVASGESVTNLTVTNGSATVSGTVTNLEVGTNADEVTVSGTATNMAIASGKNVTLNAGASFDSIEGAGKATFTTGTLDTSVTKGTTTYKAIDLDSSTPPTAEIEFTATGFEVTKGAFSENTTTLILNNGESYTTGGITYKADNGTGSTLDTKISLGSPATAEVTQGKAVITGSNTSLAISTNGGTVQIGDGTSTTSVGVVTGPATVMNNVTLTLKADSTLSYCGYTFTADASDTGFTTEDHAISIAGDAEVEDDTDVDNEEVAITVTSGTTTITDAITVENSSIETKTDGNVAINASVNGSVTIGSGTANVVNADISGTLAINGGETSYTAGTITTFNVAGGTVNLEAANANNIALSSGTVNVNENCAGTITASGASSIIIASDKTATAITTTNTDETVAITGTATATVTTLTANGTTSVDAGVTVSSASGTGSVTNAGALTVKAGKNLATLINNGTAAISGTVTDSLTGSGTVTVGGAKFTPGDGAVMVETAGVVNLNDSTKVSVSDGTLATTGNGTVTLANGTGIKEDGLTFVSSAANSTVTVNNLEYSATGTVVATGVPSANVTVTPSTALNGSTITLDSEKTFNTFTKYDTYSATATCTEGAWVYTGAYEDTTNTYINQNTDPVTLNDVTYAANASGVVVTTASNTMTAGTATISGTSLTVTGGAVTVAASTTMGTLDVDSPATAAISGTVTDSLTGSGTVTVGGAKFTPGDGAVMVETAGVVNLNDSTKVSVTVGTLATTGNGTVTLAINTAITNNGMTFTATPATGSVTIASDGISTTGTIVITGTIANGKYTLAAGSSLSYCGYTFTAGEGGATFTIGELGISIYGPATVTDDTAVDNTAVAITVTSGTTAINTPISVPVSSITTSGSGAVTANNTATIAGNVTIGGSGASTFDAAITGNVSISNGTNDFNAAINGDVTITGGTSNDFDGAITGSVKASAGTSTFSAGVKDNGTDPVEEITISGTANVTFDGGNYVATKVDGGTLNISTSGTIASLDLNGGMTTYNSGTITGNVALDNALLNVAANLANTVAISDGNTDATINFTATAKIDAVTATVGKVNVTEDEDKVGTIGSYTNSGAASTVAAAITGTAGTTVVSVSSGSATFNDTITGDVSISGGTLNDFNGAVAGNVSITADAGTNTFDSTVSGKVSISAGTNSFAGALTSATGTAADATNADLTITGGTNIINAAVTGFVYINDATDTGTTTFNTGATIAKNVTIAEGKNKFNETISGNVTITGGNTTEVGKADFNIFTDNINGTVTISDGTNTFHTGNLGDVVISGGTTNIGNATTNAGTIASLDINGGVVNYYGSGAIGGNDATKFTLSAGTMNLYGNLTDSLTLDSEGVIKYKFDTETEKFDNTITNKTGTTNTLTFTNSSLDSLSGGEVTFVGTDKFTITNAAKVNYDTDNSVTNVTDTTNTLTFDGSDLTTINGGTATVTNTDNSIFVTNATVRITDTSKSVTVAGTVTLDATISSITELGTGETVTINAGAFNVATTAGEDGNVVVKNNTTAAASATLDLSDGLTAKVPGGDMTFTFSSSANTITLTANSTVTADMVIPAGVELITGENKLTAFNDVTISVKGAITTASPEQLNTTGTGKFVFEAGNASKLIINQTEYIGNGGAVVITGGTLDVQTSDGGGFSATLSGTSPAVTIQKGNGLMFGPGLDADIFYMGTNDKLDVTNGTLKIVAPVDCTGTIVPGTVPGTDPANITLDDNSYLIYGDDLLQEYFTNEELTLIKRSTDGRYGYYPNLQIALNNANSVEDVIMLTCDIDMSEKYQSLIVTKPVTINGKKETASGNSPNYCLTGNGTQPIFDVDANGLVLRLQDLDLTKGYSEDVGGAIRNYSDSILKLENVNISNSEAIYGGGIYTRGEMTITGACNFSGNEASRAGGAIYADATVKIDGEIKGKLYTEGQLTQYSIQFNGNKASEAGAAIYTSGSLTLTESSVLNQNGSAVYINGTGTFQNVDFLFNNGSALYVDGGTTTLNGNVVFAGNKAENGAGVYLFSGTLETANPIAPTDPTVEPTDPPTLPTETQFFPFNEEKSIGALYTAYSAQFIGNESSVGGAVYIQGTATLNDVYMAYNTAKLGGAAYVWSGSLTSVGTYTNNYASSMGGAVYSEAGLTLTGSTIEYNWAGDNYGDYYAPASADVESGPNLVINAAAKKGIVYNYDKGADDSQLVALVAGIGAEQYSDTVNSDSNYVLYTWAQLNAKDDDGNFILSDETLTASRNKNAVLAAKYLATNTGVDCLKEDAGAFNETYLIDDLSQYVSPTDDQWLDSTSKWTFKGESEADRSFVKKVFESSSAAACDFDSNMVVDMADFIHFAQSFNQLSSASESAAQSDLDGNGKVDMADFIVFATQFNQKIKELGVDTAPVAVETAPAAVEAAPVAVVAAPVAVEAAPVAVIDDTDEESAVVEETSVDHSILWESTAPAALSAARIDAVLANDVNDLFDSILDSLEDSSDETRKDYDFDLNSGLSD